MTYSMKSSDMFVMKFLVVTFLHSVAHRIRGAELG